MIHYLSRISLLLSMRIDDGLLHYLVIQSPVHTVHVMNAVGPIAVTCVSTPHTNTHRWLFRTESHDVVSGGR